MRLTAGKDQEPTRVGVGRRTGRCEHEVQRILQVVAVFEPFDQDLVRLRSDIAQLERVLSRLQLGNAKREVGQDDVLIAWQRRHGGRGLRWSDDAERLDHAARHVLLTVLTEQERGHDVLALGEILDLVLRATGRHRARSAGEVQQLDSRARIALERGGHLRQADVVPDLEELRVALFVAVDVECDADASGGDGIWGGVAVVVGPDLEASGVRLGAVLPIAFARWLVLRLSVLAVALALPIVLDPRTRSPARCWRWPVEVSL